MAEVANSRDARRRRRILDQGSDRLAFITGRIQTLPPTLPDSAASSTQFPHPNTTLSASGTFLRFSPSIPVLFSETPILIFLLCFQFTTPIPFRTIPNPTATTTLPTPQSKHPPKTSLKETF